MKYIFPFLLFTNIYSHDITNDFINWKSYYRISTISENNNYGIGFYTRLNRKTKFTFRDLRLFSHYNPSGDTYLKLRYKQSNKFIKLKKFYKFNVLTFDKNEKIGLNIRSHASQGIGFFLIQYNGGHVNSELSFSYDMMDHLNDTKKTSYIKTGLFWDNNYKKFDIKLELESIFQISDIVKDDLSRIEILFEFYYSLYQNINIIGGYELENFLNKPEIGESFFLSIGYKTPINLKI